MCGRPSTTVGFERLYNPLTRLDRQAFLREMTESVPARPLNMAMIEATNRGLVDAPWAMLTSAAPVGDVGPDTVDSGPSDTVVIDVREPSEYAAGHIPNAVNVPQADLASRLVEVPRDRPVYLVCHSGSRSLRAAQFLRQMGYEQVANLRGGMAAWRAAGRPLDVNAGAGPAPHVVESEWMHAGATIR
jgi:rhodanese-related sulfurtransferase